MHPDLKKTLKALSLDLRHLLEGRFDAAGMWRAGDLEQRLNALGVWRDRAPLPADELPHLSERDRQSRAVVDAYLALRRDAGIALADAVGEFVRETAYTWANRLLALRCMEARGLIDEVILQKAVYGGRSLEHHRLAQRQPELCLGEDDGLFAALEAAFARQAEHLPLLFDPRAPGVALRPSAAALKQAVTRLSDAPGAVFQAADALGWAYQYWNTEEKDRVFEKVRTQRGAKIAGADIIPTTQLYTEPYMVKFLVQNSLGALWLGLHPGSRLAEGWEYYVRDADRAPVERKALRDVTFLDPACGSGHFLLEAFDLFYAMYEEEATSDGRPLTAPEICAAILEYNLYGIDIDERAVQIAEAALWMRAAEKIMEATGPATLHNLKSKIQNLVATNIRLPHTQDHLAAFLAQHPEDHDLRPALEVIFEGLAHADELGSLLQLEEPVEKELRYLQAKMEERRGKPEQLALLAQVEKPKQGELPLGVESYAEWKTRTLARLKAHFAAEAQAADLSQAFFGRSAEKGVRLFDLLARRYDVVAANPPYMGSGNMGTMLKQYLAHCYSSGKRDLFAAFIIRCIEFADANGHTAMVTQQSWMFLRSFADLRAKAPAKTKQRKLEVFTGLLHQTTIEVLAHLGRGAFNEISGEVVNSVMFVLANVRAEQQHSITAFRVIGPDTPSEKDKLLQSYALSESNSAIKRLQCELLNVPDYAIQYWISKPLFERLCSKDKHFANFGFVAHGLGTRCDSIVVRFHWEVNLENPAWYHYSKGGGYGKWIGRNYYVVNYAHDGAFIRSYLNERYPYLKGNLSRLVADVDYYFESGLCYSEVGRGSLGVRQLLPNSIPGHRGPGIYPDGNSLSEMAGYLNCRINSYLYRAINPSTLLLDYSYFGSLPIEPQALSIPGLGLLAELATALKLKLISCDLTEAMFSAPSLFEIMQGVIFGQLAATLHSIEGVIERLVIDAFELSVADLTSILEETGLPAGWFPLITGYDVIPDTLINLPNLPIAVPRFFNIHERLQSSSEEIETIKRNLQIVYQAGPGSNLLLPEDTCGDAEEDGDDGNMENCAAHVPIPTETFLEELSQKLHIHPISVYWLLKEGIEQEGWRCLPEERRITADRFTVLILRLLGHRWPKQIEVGEPVPAWADPDGIIPLTEGTAEPTLLARIRERLPLEFPSGEAAALEREFQELLGESLDAWLGQTFFKHHTSQFKKRPIAWQLQSGRWTARQKPAFACLVYYHQLDGDTLATLQSQYVRPLRQRYETELRGIESVPANARSARQDARRMELGDLIQELGDFDAALGRVAAEGFAAPALEQIIAREPVDRWCAADGVKAPPEDRAALLRQEQRYLPDLNDGVRVNIAPLQKAGLLAAEVLAKKDVAPAIADRAAWRADERRWCREGKLSKPGWWE